MSFPAGHSAAQVAGTGSVLSILGPTSATSPTPVVVGEVVDFDHSGMKRGTVMATNFDSLGVAKKLGTILDCGTATFTCNRIGSNAGQAACLAALAAGGEYPFTLQLPINKDAGQTTAGDLISITGIVTEGGAFGVNTDKISQSKFTIDINSYTVTIGS